MNLKVRFRPAGQFALAIRQSLAALAALVIAAGLAGCSTPSTGVVDFIKYTSDSKCVFWNPHEDDPSDKCIIHHIPSGRTLTIPGRFLADDPAASRWVIAESIIGRPKPACVVSLDEEGQVKIVRLPDLPDSILGPAAFVPGTDRIVVVVQDVTQKRLPNQGFPRLRLTTQIGGTSWKPVAPEDVTATTAADRVEKAFEADACVEYGVATSESSYRFSNQTGGKNVRVVSGPDKSGQLVEILSPDGETKLIVKKSTYAPPFFPSARPRYGDCYVRLQHLDSGQVVTLAENTELLGNILVDFTIRPVGEVLLPFFVKGVPDI